MIICILPVLGVYLGSTVLCSELENDKGERPALKTKGVDGRLRKIPDPQWLLASILLASAQRA